MRTGAVLVFLLAIGAGGIRAQSWVLKIQGPGLGNPLAVNPLNDDILYAAVGGNRVYVSRNRGYSWSEYGTLLGGGGIIKSIAVSPLDTQKILVGVESSVGFPDRIMRSTDAGANWAQTWLGTFSYFGQPVESSPLHPDTVYTMGLDTLYRSVDFGATWDTVRTGTGFNAWCDASLRPDSAGVMYVGDNTSGIWKTADGGSSWRKVYTTIGEIPSIAIDPLNPRVAYAGKFGGGGGMVKSTDWGETWHPLAVPSGNRDTWWIACSPSHPGYVYYGTYTGDTAYRGIYVSADSGATWSRINSGLNSGSFFNYGLLALDSLTVLALQSDGLYRYQFPTTIDVIRPDGGEYLLSDSVYQVEWSASGLYYVALEYSIDNGASWTAIADSVPASQGSWPWTVPASPSGSCLVRIRDALFTATAGTSAAPFTITDSHLHLLSPDGAETWDAGSIHPVAWTSFGLDTLTIGFSADSGTSWAHVAKVPAPAGAFSWTVPDIPTASALVRLRGTADTNIVDVSREVFTIASPDEFTAAIVVADAGTGVDTLSFGLIAGATDSLDPGLGETELGPLPPPGTFDARWYLAGTNGLGSDYRDTFAAPQDTRIYSALVQAGPGGLPVTLSWDPGSLSTGTLVMRDRLTSGERYNVNMRRDSALVAGDPPAGVLEIVHCPGSSVTIAGNGSWRLISLPVENGERRAASLFPFSPGGAYGYRNGYTKRDSLRFGEGYWMKTDGATLSGCPVSVETATVMQGWNIVGVPAGAVPAAAVGSDPETLAVSPFYAYGPGGYVPADTLFQGEGYWVKCRDSGRLILSGQSQARPAASSERYGRPTGALTAVPKNGPAGTLYFGPGTPGGSIESPPPPPGESETLTFKGGKMGVFHDPSPIYPVDYEIDLNDAQTEIFFRWTVEIQENLEYILVEKRSGRDFSRCLLRGSGACQVLTVPGSQFVVRVLPRRTVSGGTPSGYSLGEWYPNPFNPSTHVLLELPFESSVSYTVFNVLGERVSASANLRYPAGGRRLEWNPARDGATPLGSGVYFIALTAAPLKPEDAGRSAVFRAVRKVVFIR